MDKIKIVLALVAVVLIFGGIFLILSENKNPEKPLENTEDKDIGVYIPSKVETKSEELKINSKIPFEIGKKYEYIGRIEKNLGEFFENKSGDLKVIKMNLRYKYSVDRVEKIDKKEYYVLNCIAEYDMREMKEIAMKENNKKYMMMPDKVEMFYEIYFDKETGEILKAKQKMGNIEVELNKSRIKDTGMDTILLPYSLALNDSFVWKQEITREENGFSVKYIEEVKVVGREKIKFQDKESECFKCEIIYRQINENGKIKRIKAYAYAWIDVNERITIKQQIKVEGLVGYEVELISEE